MTTTKTTRRIRSTLVALALAAGLLTLSPGTAHALDLYGGGYCVSSITHSVNPSAYVSFSPICTRSGLLGRMWIYDFDINNWVVGNWTYAENGYTYGGDISGAQSVWELAYVQYGYSTYGGGVHSIGWDVVHVDESADNLWGYNVNWG